MSNPENTAPSPMTYTVEHFPNAAQRRALLAQQADSLTVAELKERAAEAHIDTAGATSKPDLVNAVRTAARGKSA